MGKKVSSAARKKRQKEARDRWNKKNPERWAVYKRTEKLRKYGITIDDYEILEKRQGGVCAICLNPNSEVERGKRRRLHVDHCHKTGKVRGLLCGNCNRAIGIFQDDPLRVESAAMYLRGKPLG